MPLLRRLLAASTVAALAVAPLAACSSSSGSDATSTTRAATTTAPADTGPTAGRAQRVRGPNEVTGPVTGGKYGIPYLAMPAGWEQKYGYTEHEYFIAGDAQAYGVDGALSADGRWDAIGTNATQAYKTRIIVRRPEKAASFNGTVVVEWLNVSAGRDSDPDFGFLADELLTKGYAYIGVSAQSTGVEPGGLGMEIPDVPKAALAPLKDWDPERYSTLHHPGDQWSYDMFSQAARTALDTGKDSVLGGLKVQKMIAAGESQSSFRMVSYIDAVQPLTHLFDGFLVHSRGTSAAELNPDPKQKPPAGVQIRTDTDVPVFQFETETDLDFLDFVPARQDDNAHLVTWEVAGAAHADRSTLDYGVLAGRRWAKGANIDFSTTCGQINEGPQQPVVQTAFAALAEWVSTGTKPPASPRIDVDAKGDIVRDADGIATGGIRTPPVDAPTSVLTGTNPSKNAICVLFGSTTPFTPAQLSAHWSSHQAYVNAVTASADKAVDDGFLLERHARAFIAQAKAAPVP